jgi:energy-converting hydrogenase Eha subunit C
VTWYAFDERMWYVGEVADGSPGATPIAPPIVSTTETPGEPRAMWARYRWVVNPYQAPASPPPPPPPPPAWDDPGLDSRYHWIDVGPFFDRFGAAALAVASSESALARGMIALVTPRQYVDLKRADVAAMVGMLVTAALIDTQLASTILDPVTTEYERHVKGLPQPT